MGRRRLAAADRRGRSQRSEVGGAWVTQSARPGAQPAADTHCAPVLRAARREVPAPGAKPTASTRGPGPAGATARTPGSGGSGPSPGPRGRREKEMRGARAALQLLLLGLGLLVAPAARAEEYDYYGWQAEPLPGGGAGGGRFYSKPPQCLDIPADLALCHTVGYKRMRLPNLLEHESLAEVKQQASSWVPLLAKRCHSDTQVFLCSLFAPVCLDRPIYPCRSLCEAVRDGCSPLMGSYGFPWPEMLHCHKFPLDNDLCITVQFGHVQATAPPVSKICAQCEMEHSADGLMEQMCSSDFVVKMRIKEIKSENGDRKLIGAQKKKKILKTGPLKRKDTKKLVLYMKNGANCPCPQLDSLTGNFLIMGRKVEGQLLLTAVYRWEKKNKEMKFAVKFMFSYPCSLYYPIFYGAAEQH